MDIPEGDLVIETTRSRGAGGQHVNTTDSAVRITHIPTNTVVSIQDERSQHRNKAQAMEIIKAKVYAIRKAEADKQRSDVRRSMIGTGDRFWKAKESFFFFV
jgi:peptide chain release factor 1